MRLPLVFVLATLVLASPASANYVVKDGNGVLQTIHSIPCSGGVICPSSSPTDQNGNPAGIQGNPLVINGQVSTTFVPANVSCGSTATLMLSADNTKIYRAVFNVGSSTIYFGNSNLTSSTGMPINPGGGWDFSHYQGALYCITATGSDAVNVVQY